MCWWIPVFLAVILTSFLLLKTLSFHTHLPDFLYRRNALKAFLHFPGGAIDKKPPANAGDVTQEDPICRWETKPVVILAAKLCLSPSWPPWTVACQAPLSMGFPRQEYWSGLSLPSPGISPTQGWNLCLLHWQVGSLPVVPPGKPS